MEIITVTPESLSEAFDAVAVELGLLNDRLCKIEIQLAKDHAAFKAMIELFYEMKEDIERL
jgi:hypothetical protein